MRELATELQRHEQSRHTPQFSGEAGPGSTSRLLWADTDTLPASLLLNQDRLSQECQTSETALGGTVLMRTNSRYTLSYDAFYFRF